MKKLPILLILIFISQFSFSQDFDFIRDGEYATYHDTRGDSDILRMYWGIRIEDGSLGFYIRNIDNKTSEQINYFAIITEGDDGTPELEEVKGYSEDHPSEYYQSLIDLMNFLVFYKENEEIIIGDVKIEDQWDI